MFLQNCWYCAGWDFQVTQGKESIVARKIAGKRLVLYRKPGGALVAMEDLCPHRAAALSRGRKEGDSLRCMYHGLRFDPQGRCTEIPGQERIPPQACVRVFPVVEKDNWIWVWMGEADAADPALICDAIGPGHPDFNVQPSYLQIDADYRLEHANLADLSHSSFTHDGTIAMGWAQALAKPEFKLLPRGLKSDWWVRSAPLPKFVQHLFPDGFLCDAHFDITQTVPLNWILHFRVFTAGTATTGESDGALIMDSWSCQTITPRDENSVDYYFSWGVSKATDQPGLSDLLKEGLDQAFMEDKLMLEAQQLRLRENPGFKPLTLAIDAGPVRILAVLDRLLQEEADAALASAG
ncbi:MAG: Rieske 2Fe-2S domain-containing protein [Gammaproteobacteria bacterium]